MGEPLDLQAVGARIEALLDELAVAIIPREYEHVEELVRLVTELYGAGLERVLDIIKSSSPPLVVSRVAADLADDELIASLLLVHGLHPDGLEARVGKALESVRPFLRHHDGDVELLGIDEPVGAVHLRLLGSCDGCPSSSVTLQHAVERAINEAAPEIVIIDVEARDPEVVPAAGALDSGVPVALGRKPAYERCPSEVVGLAGA